MGRNSRKGGEASDESLRGKIRELQKEIRRRDHEVKYLKKEIERATGRRPKDVERVKADEPNCPSCGKGVLKLVEIPRRGMTTLILSSCAICGYKDKKHE